MDIADVRKGTVACLPDGSLLKIEIVYPDGDVGGRRRSGRWRGRIAICAADKLTVPDVNCDVAESEAVETV